MARRGLFWQSIMTANQPPSSIPGKLDQNFDPIPVICLPNSQGLIDDEWLQSVRQAFPNSRFMTVPRLAEAHQLEACPELSVSHTGWLVKISTWLDQPSLVIESGLSIPLFLNQRLQLILQEENLAEVMVLSGNYNPALNPVGDLSLDCPGASVDRLIWHFSEGVISSIEPNLVNEAKAALVSPQKNKAVSMGVTDLCFLHDPRKPIQSKQAPASCLTRAFGSVRHRLVGSQEQGDDDNTYLGLDGMPVTLHITHNWGGGISRWINDVCKHDRSSHHLVLTATHPEKSKLFGQSLTLYAQSRKKEALHHFDLEPMIADTTNSHEGYGQFIAWVIKRYGVSRMIVSSVIGHSLDCLRQNVPTLQVLHDFYPASPVLDADPLTYLDSSGHFNFETCLEENREHFIFYDEAPERWQRLKNDWYEAVHANQIALLAPTQHVSSRWQALFGGQLPRIHVIPHGFDQPAEWRDAKRGENDASEPPAQNHFVILGRLSSGKGLKRLCDISDHFGNRIRLSVIGGGFEAMQLFGRPNVDIILDYDEASLPKHLAHLNARAALFLSRVPETWNYVLSEAWALRLAVIAPDLGSFHERISHGVNGLLYPPSTDDLIELLEQVISGDLSCPEVSEHIGEPSMADTLKAYENVIAYGSRPSQWCVMPNRPQASVRIIEEALNQKERQLDRATQNQAILHERINEQADLLARLDRTLKERTDWALSLEKVITAQSLPHPDSDNPSNTNIEIEALQRKLLQAQQERDWSESQLAEVRDSRSWRLTRPFRVFARIIRALHQRKAWLPSNWLRQTKRFIHAVRLHGWRTTIEALQHQKATGETHRHDFENIQHPTLRDASQPIVFSRLKDISQPAISLIIPVFNNLAYTAHCLRSLQETDEGLAIEIIVVNDCSTDDTAEFLEQCEGIKVITLSSNSGFIASCNAGAQRASGDHLVFLNNDIQVTPGWLTHLMSPFHHFPKTGIVGAKLVYPDGSLQEAGGIIFNDGSGWNYGRLGSPHNSQVQFLSQADYVSGACLAIRAELFGELDGFDSHYCPAYYEDTDLCFKARQHGWDVLYQPSTVIIHFEGISNGTSESSGIKRYQAVNRKKFRERWKDVLAKQPPPVPGPEAKVLIEQARHHRSRGHILVVDAVTPQPDHDSGSVRMVTLLEILIDMGYRVTFVPVNLAWDGDYSQSLRDRGIETLNHPDISSIKQWLQHYGQLLDYVVGSRYYVLDDILSDVREYCPNAKVIFDTVDLHFLREQRRADLENDTEMAKLAQKTEKKELSLISESDITLVVSPIEQSILQKKLPDARVEILSNIHTPVTAPSSFSHRSGILFVGGFQHPPNVDAAKWLIDEILPALIQVNPSIELHLIGSRMPEWLKSIRAPGLRNHGFVPDLVPFLSHARLAVAPLRYGAGVKGKVNQAMAHGLPVVATEAAAEGMYAEPEKDLLIANTTDSFVSQILRLYDDEALWQTLSAAGLENVRRYFSKQAAQAHLESILSGSSGSHDTM